MDQLATLLFPLNVYALLLEWETGSADHLHYGIFDHPDEPVQTAQARAVELLLEHLPTGSRLLEVGCGFGGLTARLAAAGHRVTGINPDPAQLAIARQRHGEDLPVQCLPLEEFHQGEGEWDALLFHESGQYVPLLELWERADALLGEQGEVLLLDECALERREPGREGLHLKPHLLALARRFGFECTTDLDLSAKAAPTLEFLLAAVERHRERLLTIPGVTPEALERLQTSNRAYRERYADGRFGYALLKFRRTGRPRWRVGAIRPGHVDAMRELFEQVFRHPLSPAEWEWKYGQGRGVAIGVWEGGELVAHYGGLIRSIRYFGRPERAMQSGDVMVAPRARGGFSRQGPFFLAAATYLEQHMGFGTGHLMAYGFPNRRALELPAKLGLYRHPQAHVTELEWPPAPRAGGVFHRVRPLDTNREEERRIIDQLWEAMAREMGDRIIGVRDGSYWHHRYTSHPRLNYLSFLVYRRFSRRPVGVVALKPDGERLELMDWVAGEGDLPLVVAAARGVAGQMGRIGLYCWASEPVVARCAALDPPPRQSDTGIDVPANGWTAGPPLAETAGRLWLTGGDTDFH